MVTTICYNQRKEWNNRQEAIEFFFQGVITTEGSEQERYIRILTKLQFGCNVCDDGK